MLGYAKIAFTGVLAASLTAAAPVPIGYQLEVAKDHKPWVPDSGSPSFDKSGVAYVRSGQSLNIVAPDGKARTIDLDQIAKKVINRDIFRSGIKWDGSWDKSFMTDNSVVVDDKDRIYTLIIPRYSNLKTAVLIWSSDGANTWKAVALTGRDAALEKPDGFNDTSGVPTIISFETYGGITGSRVWLDPLMFKGSDIVREYPPVLLSNRTFLIGNHSGAANSTFTTKQKIFIVYDTNDTSGPGTLSVARQFDRFTNKLEGSEIPVGRSTTLKGPDVHDIPAITMGPDRHLIVLIGAHHARFKYYTSKEAENLTSGFDFRGEIGEQANDRRHSSYSYISLNMSRSGTMNVIARSEGDDAHYELVQLQKLWHQPWTVWGNGLTHRVIAEPTRPHYAAWRQRLTVDPAGRLYLNFRFYANDLNPVEANSLGLSRERKKDCAEDRCWYDNAPEQSPVTIKSTDGGATWH